MTVHEKRVPALDVIRHRRVARRDRGFAARHELHQRQALAFARRAVDHERRRFHQRLVGVRRQVAVNHDDPARERPQSADLRHQAGRHHRGVGMAGLHQQRGVRAVAKRPDEMRQQLPGAFAPVERVDHRGVDDAVELQRPDRAIRRHPRLGTRAGRVDDDRRAHFETAAGDGRTVGEPPTQRLAPIPDGRGNARHRERAAECRPQNLRGVARVNDRGAEPPQHRNPVIARLTTPDLVRYRVELPGEHRDRRAAQAHPRLVRRIERQEHAILPARLRRRPVRVDLARRILDVQDRSHLLQQWPEQLLDEIIAVFRPADMGRDRTRLRLGIGEDQHEATRSSRTGAVPDRAVAGSATPRKRRSRASTTASAQSERCASIAAPAMASHRGRSSFATL